jgi:type I restriction-modification system DNA methylase subunit
MRAEPSGKATEKIWRIANDFRLRVTVGTLKRYLRGPLSYRFISENLTHYLKANTPKPGELGPFFSQETG